MDNHLNRYDIPYNQMLHDLSVLKMQRKDDLPVNDNEAMIAYYYETMEAMNESLNEYLKTHEF